LLYLAHLLNIFDCVCVDPLGAAASGGLGALLADLQEPAEAAEYRISIEVRKPQQNVADAAQDYAFAL
jgi:hypothetical protein